MSLLPSQIIPASNPLGVVQEDGKTVMIDKNWWLFLYNLFLNSNPGSSDPETLFLSQALTLPDPQSSKSGGMTNPMTTTGDTIYSSDNSGTPARLGIGSTGNVLTVSGGLPAWEPPSGLTNPMTTTGDIIYSSDNSGTPTRLGIGAGGDVLTSVSGIPAWAVGSQIIAITSTGSYVLPTGYRQALVICMGCGGNGGPGSNSASSGGGGAGGGSGSMTWAAFAPGVLTQTVYAVLNGPTPYQASSITWATTYLSTNNDATLVPGNTILASYNGMNVNSVGGSNVATTTPVISSSEFLFGKATALYFNIFGGSAGSNNSTNITASQTWYTGGTGGGGVIVGSPGTNGGTITGYTPAAGTVAGGIGAPNSSTPGSDGNNGTTNVPGGIFGMGGTGGGGGWKTSGGAATAGGNGANGFTGCGGGGGGGSDGAGAGTGGLGGGGVILICLS